MYAYRFKSNFIAVSGLQGEAGDLFYIIKAGEAVVYQDADGGPKKVNHLFKADYFGEKALLTSAPRCATGGLLCCCRARMGRSRAGVSDRQTHTQPMMAPVLVLGCDGLQL